MRDFNKASKSDLLNIMCEFGDFPNEQDFFDFFNDIRNEYCQNRGIRLDKPFATSRDQFYKWMKQGKGIQKKNLTQDMASFILCDLYYKKEDCGAIPVFLTILGNHALPTQDFLAKYQALRSAFAADAVFGQLYEEIATKLVTGVFCTEQAAKPQAEPSDNTHAQTKPKVPKYLTAQKYLAPTRILYRDQTVADIEKMLLPASGKQRPGKTNVVISGFGGWGKTSIARLVFGRMLDAVDSGIYQSIGWIDYHVDLKDSILSTNAVKLFEDMKEKESRWQMIRRYILEENSDAKFLLFIDNVDLRANLRQDPKADTDLQNFADAPNVNLVITSRLAAPLRADSFSSVKIESLSPDACVELFYLYCDSIQRNDQNTQYIRQLVSLANQHTLAVKLLACGAQYQDLAEYCRKISKSGFHFSLINGDEEQNAADELRKLFDLQSRTDEQFAILWGFAVLPQVTLSLDDALFLIGCGQKDLQALVEEGWLSFDSGFYLHPLIKKVVLMGLDNGFAPTGTMTHLIRSVADNRFLGGCDSYSDRVRRISIIYHASGMLQIPKELSAKFYYHLGMAMYENGRMRLSSIHMLQQAASDILNSDPPADNGFLAMIHYNLGYIMSTTEKHRADASRYLEDALRIWVREPHSQIEADMARDHLGYVLSDTPERWAEAEDLLRRALAGRKQRYLDHPDADCIRDYATTCDNLGFLLSKRNPGGTDARKYLEEAYSLRKKVYNSAGNNATEVAWTAFNIGQYLESTGAPEEALRYYRVALNLRREQGAHYPGVYSASILFTLVAIMKLSVSANIQLQDFDAMCREAKQLRSVIDAEHTGFYMEELDKELCSLLEYKVAKTNEAADKRN